MAPNTENPPLYFDNNASTRVDTEVLEAMQRYIGGCFGNPSSGHWASEGSREALEGARQSVATLIGAKPGEIVLTSGGTESNNHAIKGVVLRALREQKSAHMIITAVEHPAVMEPCRYLEHFGATLTVVPVDATGRVAVDAIKQALRPDTCLVSVMHANNEIGTVQPIAEIGSMLRAVDGDVAFHVDAAQSLGKIPLDAHASGIDLLTVAGHKLHAPKGIGALFVREGIALDNLLHGAKHERGRRPGTENVAFAVGLGRAARVAAEWIAAGGPVKQAAVREIFWRELSSAFGDSVVRHGSTTAVLPNTLSVGFLEFAGRDVLAEIPWLAATTGSACNTRSQALSPVMSAIGASAEAARGTIRFSLGRSANEEQVRRVVAALLAATKRLN